MAAYAALVSLARLIDQILPQTPDYAFLCDKRQMESLHEKVNRLQEFFEHNSAKSVSLMVDKLESRIRDAAYQLEHIIESIICKSLGQPAKTSSLMLAISCIGGKNGEAESHTSPSMEQVTTVFCNCIAEIDIMEEATAKKYLSAAHSSTTSSSREATTAEVINVGLKNACTRMLDTITGQTSSLLIIPITGMGGIGKTTLASAVYNNSRSLRRFDVRLWVTISQEYDLQEVLRGLLSTVKQSEQPDGSLFDRVHKYLKGRRFLIVLDDMWHGKAWDGVMNAFPDDNKGSRIIITTRELGVATYVGSLSNVHEMQLLSENQSWVMLRKKVYGDEPCPVELGDIGRTISKNCKGLPLAITVIAGLLKRNKLKDYWEEIAENTNAAAASMGNDHFLGIVSLSYTNLPPQLKACFLYFGGFPEDYVFRTKELVMLLIAEGFIKPRESKTMEHIAEECIEELVERSIVMVKKKTYSGKIKTFSIHDVLREVSIRKANEEKFVKHYGTYKNDLNRSQSYTCDAHIRSLRYYASGYQSRWTSVYNAVTRNRYRNYRINDSMLGALCKLTSLRYLYVESHPLHILITFPKSISKLQNLETLIINNVDNAEIIIPLDIWKLQRLRHIVLRNIAYGGTLQSPVSVGGYPVLDNLQTLSGWSFINLNTDFISRIPNVKRMKLIYDSVTINYWQLFSLSNLQHLHQLENLYIECPGYHGDMSLPPPSGLAFPLSLKRLSLTKTLIPLENLMSVVGSLPNLEVLKLRANAVIGDIWEPIEGEFLQLKYLNMYFIDIKEWRAESVHFPCIEKIEITNCSYLKEVPESIGESDTLEELVLTDCRDAKESVLKIRENQQALGNDSLKIIIRWC